MRREAAAESDGRLGYWRQRLAEPPPHPELPRATPPVAEAASRPLRRVLALPAGTARTLEAGSAGAGVQPTTWLLAAAAAWLFRFTRQSDLLLGAIAGGDGPLPLRVRVASPLPFDTLLRRVEGDRREAEKHRLPLEAIASALGLDAGGLAIAGTVAVGAAAPEPEAPGRVALAFVSDAHGDRLELGCDAGALPEPAAARMLECLGKLLEGTLRDPTQCISELPLLTELERGLLLHEWQGPPLAYPHTQCFHQLFEEQAARTPHAVAVCYEESTLTYVELEARANALARALVARGVGLESRVGVYMDNSLELPVAVLGVFKAGATYVPLSTGHPPAYLEYIAGDTGIQAVVVRAADDRRPELEGAVFVPVSAAGDTPEDGARVDPPATGDTLCAVLYTSGSTGEPKGVELSHAALLSRLYWMQEVGRLDASDRHVLLAPMHIARFVGQLFWPLLTGGHIHITRPDGDRDNAYLLDLFRRRQITSVHLGPTIARMLLMRADELRACTSLRNVFCSGEAFPVGLQHELAAQIPFATLHKCYGLAETNFVSYCRYGDPKQTATIGRPNYMRVYILDDSLQPVPIGVPGEICASGIGLARGFANKPDLVAKRFAPDPFSSEPGAFMYRTGDLGRWLADGNLDFIGRVDHQIKVRGFPVDTGEIEVVLERHPALAAAVVTARESRGGDARLVAYVVAGSPDDAPEPAALRAFLLERLPSYMIPSAFVVLDRIPMRSGKIDRTGLPEPPAGRPLPDATYVAAEDPLQERLVAIWEDLLELEGIGIDDDFFDLGGHSLLATRLIWRITQSLDVELRFGELFENARIRALADVIRHKETTRAPRIDPVPARESHDLTPMQEAFYVLEQIERSAPFNCKACLAVEGPLRVEALERAWHAVLERHEALRSTICFVEGQPKQRFHATVPAPLECIDLAGAQPQEPAVLAQVRKLVSARFDLEGPALVRGSLLRLGESRYLLVVAAPHIISDGWSQNVMLRDLLQLYAADVSGEPSPLPALPFQYKDFASFYLESQGAEQLAAHRDYWYGVLGGDLPVLDLETDFPRPELKTLQGESHFFRIEPDARRDLEALARRTGTTPFMVLVAAVKLLLYASSGQRDVIVGTPMAGRSFAELENQVGNYIHVVALRDRIEPRGSFRAFLAAVKKTILEAHEHQHLPFNHLVYELDISLDLGRSLVFDVLVAYHNYRGIFRGRQLLGELDLKPSPIGAGTSRFDLSFDFYEYDHEVVVEIEYATEIFLPSRIERLATDLVRLLRASAADPDACIDDLRDATEGTSA